MPLRLLWRWWNWQRQYGRQRRHHCVSTGCHRLPSRYSGWLRLVHVEGGCWRTAGRSRGKQNAKPPCVVDCARWNDAPPISARAARPEDALLSGLPPRATSVALPGLPVAPPTNTAHARPVQLRPTCCFSWTPVGQSPVIVLPLALAPWRCLENRLRRRMFVGSLLKGEACLRHQLYKQACTSASTGPSTTLTLSRRGQSTIEQHRGRGNSNKCRCAKNVQLIVKKSLQSLGPVMAVILAQSWTTNLLFVVRTQLIIARYGRLSPFHVR